MSSTRMTTRQSLLGSPTTRSNHSQVSSIRPRSPPTRQRPAKPVSVLPAIRTRTTIVHDEPISSTTHTPDPIALESPPEPPVQSSSSALTSPVQVKASPSASRKGKARAVEPEIRVLPARIRRAAGGGAEGIRDLEEMIVDWLERWGECIPNSLIS